MFRLYTQLFHQFFKLLYLNELNLKKKITYKKKKMYFLTRVNHLYNWWKIIRSTCCLRTRRKKQSFWLRLNLKIVARDPTAKSGQPHLIVVGRRNPSDWTRARLTVRARRIRTSALQRSTQKRRSGVLLPFHQLCDHGGHAFGGL